MVYRLLLLRFLLSPADGTAHTELQRVFPLMETLTAWYDRTTMYASFCRYGIARIQFSLLLPIDPDADRYDRQCIVQIHLYIARHDSFPCGTESMLSLHVFHAGGNSSYHARTATNPTLLSNDTIHIREPFYP